MGFCNELEEISERNELECIEIDIEMGYEYEAGDEWHRLESVLLKPRWRGLKCVSIAMIFYIKYHTAFEMVLKSLPHTQFTDLRASRHLNFQLSIRSDPTVWHTF